VRVAQSLRSKYGEYVLSKNLKHNKHEVHSCNINSAQSIGILFNATHSVSFEIVKNLVKELSGKKRKIMVLGFVDSKQMIDHYLYRKGFEFFTRNHLNWFDKPENEAVTEFINEEFDILINLNLEHNYPIKYILSLSKAKFKVGRLTDQHKYMDFMIDIESEKEAMREIQSELKKDGKPAKEHRTSYDNIADTKTSVELQMNFLINQLLHYLSKLK
jgi:hypothetical protein